MTTQDEAIYESIVFPDYFLLAGAETFTDIARFGQKEARSAAQVPSVFQ